jgi:hypothetical protein
MDTLSINLAYTSEEQLERILSGRLRVYYKHLDLVVSDEMINLSAKYFANYAISNQQFEFFRENGFLLIDDGPSQEERRDFNEFLNLIVRVKLINSRGSFSTEKYLIISTIDSLIRNYLSKGMPGGDVYIKGKTSGSIRG